MENSTLRENSKNSSAAACFALMLVRPLAIFCTQIALCFFFRSWHGTLSWWPFQMIVSNGICLFILFKLTKREKRPFSGIFLHPFGQGIETLKAAHILQRRCYRHRILNLLYDIGVFFALLMTLGLIAFLIAGQIDNLLQALVIVQRYEPLPRWAMISITILLPLTMPLAEVPWYFGYFFPKLETVLGAKHGNTGTAWAFILTVTVFSMQHCFQPFVLNGAFIVLRFIMELPLIVLAAGVIRIAPRFTPYILVLHGLMALEASSRYWKL